MATRDLLGAVAALLAVAPAVAARATDATAQMVIETCERALAAGYQSMDAAMCDWHVRPCGVCGETPPDSWCLPPALQGAALAREVVAALRTEADLAAPAKPQVERILRARHPCEPRHGLRVSP